MTDYIMEIKKLKKLFANQKSLLGRPINYVNAVNQVDLNIPRGLTLGIAGESGCGKSTLANLILGMEKPTEGSILYDGADIGAMTRKERNKYKIPTKIQIVAQNSAQVLSPRKTIGFLLSEPMLLNKPYHSQEAARPKVTELLERVGLSQELYNRLPHQLSGGQQQRVCIARALSLSPEIIILDEPTSSLDISVQAKVLNLLARLQKEDNLTYILITHDIRVAEYICHQIAVMYLGEIVEIINAEDFALESKHPYSRLLIESSYADDAPADNSKLQNSELPSPVNLPAGCRFVTRCSLSTDICAKEHPRLKTFKSGAKCRCHIYDKED